MQKNVATKGWWSGKEEETERKGALDLYVRKESQMERDLCQGLRGRAPWREPNGPFQQKHEPSVPGLRSGTRSPFIPFGEVFALSPCSFMDHLTPPSIAYRPSYWEVVGGETAKALLRSLRPAPDSRPAGSLSEDALLE